MRYLMIGIALALCALALAGCSGDSTESEIEAAKIKAVITTYQVGFYTGDGEKACSVMSDEFKRELTREFKRELSRLKRELAREFGLLDCVAAIEAIGDAFGFGDDQIARIRERLPESLDESKWDIQVDGATATATSSAIAMNLGGGPDVFGLEKTDGNWYIKIK